MTKKELERIQAIDREEWFEQRLNWIEEFGLKGSDVLQDETGEEFILVETEMGNPGDDYSFDTKEVYLPPHLQSSNVLI